MGGRTSRQVSLETILASAKWCGDYGKPEFCNVPDCAREPVTMSLCKAHYHYWQRHKHGQKRTNPDYAFVLPYVQPPTKGHRLTTLQRKCHVPKCLGRYEARGLCKQHYGWFVKWRKVNEMDKEKCVVCECEPCRCDEVDDKRKYGEASDWYGNDY